MRNYLWKQQLRLETLKYELHNGLKANRSLLNPLTRFFSTSPIASDDHRFIAMTKHTTNADGNFRDRSSQLPVSDRVSLITDGEITVSIALNINSASIVAVLKEKFFSCTSFSHRTSW